MQQPSTIKLSKRVYALPHFFTIRRGTVDVRLGVQQYRLFMLVARSDTPLLVDVLVDRLYAGARLPDWPLRCVYTQRVGINKKLAAINVKIETERAGRLPTRYYVSFNDDIDAAGQLELALS